MSSVRQPVGPQQPGVYWFRRGIFLLVLVLVFVGIGYLLFGRGSGTTPVAAPSSSTTPSTAPLIAPSVTPSTSFSSQPSGAPQPSLSGSGGVARTCADSDVSVVASTDKATYLVGATPKLQMRISNSSPTACRRSVGAGVNELNVYRGTTRFWSSDDCNPGGAGDVVTISPGQTYVVSVTWAGISSSANCPANPPQATAGDFSLVGVNQGERSKAAPFTFTAAD